MKVTDIAVGVNTLARYIVIRKGTACRAPTQRYWRSLRVGARNRNYGVKL
jgi:hypothetical protein